MYLIVAKLTENWDRYRIYKFFKHDITSALNNGLTITFKKSLYFIISTAFHYLCSLQIINPFNGFAEQLY